MSLDRYTNSEEILDSKGLRTGIVWKEDTLKFLNLKQLSTIPNANPRVEMHLYAPTTNELLTSVDVTNFIQDKDCVYIDFVTELNNINIQRGLFNIVINVYKPLIGVSELPAIVVKEISPDRRELQIVLRPDIEEVDQNARKAILDDYVSNYTSAYDADIALNFGKNKIYKIINQKEWINEDDLVVRLLDPLEDEIQLNDTCWIIEQYCDSIIDSININRVPQPPAPNLLKGPNFEVEAEYNTITETNFKSWNDLLDANTTTTQQIVDSYFSGSLSGINLGIDYTGFQNFINYSSAFERVSNFKYKLELMEYYDSQLNILQNASGSDTGTLQGNINKFTKRKNQILGKFDAFEKYLYYEPTSSLTTHGIDGGYIGAQHYKIMPWPKYLHDGKYKVHQTTGSLSTSWFEGVSATASKYDEQNESALIKSIPEHIRLDTNNSEYDLFVNMIGQHFDILWTYVDALTRTYNLEEQPKLSIDKSILPNIANSLGWELANGKQATQLWQYKLGTNSVGLYAQSGSIFSNSDEEITHEVWRRIVNNLPYLLKTKGTTRSIKALMNMYGIPQTLLSIREYGGPKTSEETPALIEDRFSYAIQFNSGSNINYSSNHISSSIGDWGIEKGVIPPITREFRFRPYTKENMMLYSQNASGNGTPQAAIAVQYTASYSGSADFGRLVLSLGKAAGNNIPMTASTDWVPIFNGQYWNVKYDYTTTGIHFNSGSNTDTTYNITVQNASDFIFGNINYSSSLSITPTFANHFQAWSEPGTNTSRNVVYIGARTASTDTHNVNAYLTNFLGSQADTFSGSMQEYREWLEFIDQKTFDEHTFNPTSYVSALNPSSSYDTLVRQYTLGSNTIGFDLSSNGTIISSSHPNQTIKDFNGSLPFSTNATTIGFNTPLNNARGNFIPVEETYFIQGVSSGMNSAKSQKIRFDDNTLVRTLSPTSTGERSKFDYASLDSNKVGLFYSFADQINKDMFNQIGDVELDDYIGDPDDMTVNEYPLLKQFSQKYFKKFTNTSDINSYIRIFSQYDFALFHQIKQLLAERIDEATGLLIEPHALERSKQIIAKRPSVSKPMYNMHVPEPSPTSSAIYGPQFESLINKPLSLSSSSVETNLLFEVNTKQEEALMTLNDIVADIARPSGIFREVVLHYSGSVRSGLREDKIKVNQAHAISQSLGLFYSRSLKEAPYMDDFFVKEQSIKYLGTQLVGPGINEPTKIEALENKPVVEIFETNPNQLIYSRQPKAPRGSNKIIPGNLIVE